MTTAKLALLLVAAAAAVAATSAARVPPSLPASFTAQVNYTVPFVGTVPTHLYYDGLNLRQRFDFKTSGIESHLLQLYNDRMQYHVIPQGNECDADELDQEFPSLDIAPGSEYLGKTTYQGVPVERWEALLGIGKATWLVNVRSDKVAILVSYTLTAFGTKTEIVLDPDTINVAPIDPHIFDVTQFEGCPDPQPPVSYSVSGYVTDASTGAVLRGAEVELNGETESGQSPYTFEEVPAGDTAITVSADGYSTLTRHINVTGDMQGGLANFALSKNLPGDSSWRFVLTWNAFPADLDSHFKAPGGCEVYYRQRHCGTASLDRDSTQGFGPETVTLLDAKTGTYSHWVLIYSSGSFVGSGASLSVYQGAQGVVQTLNVADAAPVSGARWWHTVDVSGSTVTVVNKLSVRRQ